MRTKESKKIIGIPLRIKSHMKNISCYVFVRNFLSAYNTPAVGASGAIYGILVAFGMSYPNSELFLIFLPVPIKAKYFIPVLIGLDLFSGVTGYSIFGDGIAHFAHVGGALFGFLMMWYWKKNQYNKNRWD